MEFGVLIFVAVAALVVVFRVLLGSVDKDRVRHYVESRGGRFLEARWNPFGPGWFGEKSDRIYQVRYVDQHGNEHHAHCKTSMWTGVYFTQDEIVSSPQPTQLAHEPESLEEENRRLREELARLRREGA